MALGGRRTAAQTLPPCPANRYFPLSYSDLEASWKSSAYVEVAEVGNLVIELIMDSNRATT
eukprot:41879-Eustigmatos_ZCMA.PRE.1